MRLLPIVRNARAEEDLIAIWLHVSGAPRDDIAPGIHHLIVSEYLILYRVREDAIEIVRVLHGRRNIGGDDVVT